MQFSLYFRYSSLECAVARKPCIKRTLYAVYLAGEADKIFLDRIDFVSDREKMLRSRDGKIVNKILKVIKAFREFSIHDVTYSLIATVKHQVPVLCVGLT